MVHVGNQVNFPLLHTCSIFHSHNPLSSTPPANNATFNVVVYAMDDGYKVVLTPHGKLGNYRKTSPFLSDQLLRCSKIKYNTAVLIFKILREQSRFYSIMYFPNYNIQHL